MRRGIWLKRSGINVNSQGSVYGANSLYAIEQVGHSGCIVGWQVYYVFLEPLYIDNGALLSNRADDSFPPTRKKTECSLLPTMRISKRTGSYWEAFFFSFLFLVFFKSLSSK